MKYAIGIDPGLTGCIVCVEIETKKMHSFYDVEKVGSDIDIAGIVKYLSQFDRQESTIFLENPHPHGTDGVKTVFAGFMYGYGVGVMNGVCSSLDFSIIKVAPTSWKGHFALMSGSLSYQEKKMLDIDKACYLSPENEAIFRHKRIDKKTYRHDRADAFLIANYGIDKYINK
ncbi:MAG: hypothetical protein EOM85_03915 [Candidatus Moranbacteria bacterium]|nr:hypothetical protein [Candidatus Moranbacteria bacterium]